MTLEQMKAFTGIQFHENVIDYVLGAFSLFSGLQDITQDYWLAPFGWQSVNFAEKTATSYRSKYPKAH